MDEHDGHALGQCPTLSKVATTANGYLPGTRAAAVGISVSMAHHPLPQGINSSDILDQEVPVSVGSVQM
jgi:hypothetical protein